MNSPVAVFSMYSLIGEVTVSPLSVLATENTKSPSVASPPRPGVGDAVAVSDPVSVPDDSLDVDVFDEDVDVPGEATWVSVLSRITKPYTAASTSTSTSTPTALRYPMSRLRLLGAPPEPSKPPEPKGGPGGPGGPA